MPARRPTPLRAAATASAAWPKGGAWYYEAEFARPSARMSFPKGSRLNVIGFRVARPLE